MFDILPKALASVASFLFPLFASYKALNTADPAQLTPWLMYWVVLACALLVESWTDWILVWVPFYHYFRLFFLLYLVLPQTQGARVLYQTHLHPWIAQHEAQIDELIGSAHARMRSAGMHYLKQAIAYLRTALGLPPAASEGDTSSAYSSSYSSSSTHGISPQSYTQALLARFTLPSARWPGGAMGSAAAAATSDPAVPSSGAADFYGLLATAVGALGTATGAAGGVAAGAAASAFSRGMGLGVGGGGGGGNMTSSGTLVPPHVQDADRASFLATQRDRLRTLLSALEREAAQLEDEEDVLAKTSPLSRPLSSASGLSKSRSEADFEKIDAESGTEEDKPVRHRRHGHGGGAPVSGSGSGGASSSGDAAHLGAGNRTTSGSWMPWGWGGGGGGSGGDGAEGPTDDDGGKSSSVEQ